MGGDQRFPGQDDRRYRAATDNGIKLVKEGVDVWESRMHLCDESHFEGVVWNLGLKGQGPVGHREDVREGGDDSALVISRCHQVATVDIHGLNEIFVEHVAS